MSASAVEPGHVFSEPATGAPTEPTQDDTTSPPGLPMSTIVPVDEDSTKESTGGSELNEITLEDDVRFSTMSTVPLSVRDSVESLSSVDTTACIREVPLSPSPQRSDDISSGDEVGPKTGEISFMRALLDAQNTIAESSDPKAIRSSLEGQSKIQEEFARLHKEQQEVEVEILGNDIDWGKHNQ